MNYNYLNNVKLFLSGIEITGFSKDDLIFEGEFNIPSPAERITSVLGNVKGIVSPEDRQLLKIIHNLSDENVDNMISEYQKQYKQYLKDSKIYGKEKWR